jgi:hypothetical protein
MAVRLESLTYVLTRYRFANSELANSAWHSAAHAERRDCFWR